MSISPAIQRPDSINPIGPLAQRAGHPPIAALRDVPARELLAWAQPQPAQIAPPRVEPTRIDGATAAAPAASAAAAGAAAPSTRELALMAADVYHDIPAPPPGYRVAGDADLARIGLDPANLSSPESAFRARVYVRDTAQGTQFVVSFRGSTDASDWKANAQQALGLPSDQYSRALMIARAIGRHPEADVTITGHSLGGGLASAAALASGRSATTFNAAGLSDATIRQAEGIRSANGGAPEPAIAAFYVRGEVLSALQDGGDRVVGALLGGLVGGILADAPEACGTRIGLDAVRPQGTHWYQDNPVARHGMDWVLSSLGAN